jgi:transposase
LPEITPEIIQYNIYTCKCLGCWKHVRGDVPKEAERGFGPRLMGFVTMLTGEGHLTKRKICSITAHLGLKISLGALCNIHRLAGDLLQTPADAIQEFVLTQERLNADESGWRVLKKRCWIWIGATSKATFFKIDPSRSSQAYRRIFGSYSGALTTDRHGAYNEHVGPKQSCLQEKASEYVENIKAALIFTAREAKNSKSAALAHDLLGRFSTLWTFLFIEGVEPTNNLAERGLRPAVIFRKLSGGNQSDWGARFTERLMTVVCTLKQNAMNTFTFLTEVFAAHQKARSPPVLAL